MSDPARPQMPAFVIAGLTVLVTCVALAAYLTWREQAHGLQIQAEQSLAAIADLKADEISSWVEERRGDAETLHENPLVPAAADDWFTHGRRAAFTADVRPLLATMMAVYDYEDILLLDADGTVRYAVARPVAGPAPVERRLIASATAGTAARVSDLYLDAGGQVMLTAVVPLTLGLTGERRVVGAILLRIDAGQFLFPTIQRWPLPSSTGETLLAEREGDSVLFLNELRHRDDTALRLRRPITSPSLPAAIAVRGQTGVTRGIDYRGNEVVFAFSRVSGTRWSLVAKMDRSEVVGPATTRAWLAGGLTAAVVLIIGFGILFWWRSRTSRAARELLEARLRAETALRESEERYRLATDNVSDVLWTIDLDRRRFTYVSPSVTALRGVTADEVVAGEVGAAFTPASWAAMENVIPERLEGFRRGIGMTHVDQIEWARKDGTTVWTETTTRYAIDENTGHTMMYGVSRDISERRRAEEELRTQSDELRESREDLNRAQAVAHTGSWRLDVRDNVLLWSEENHRLFGLPPGPPLTYETFLNCVHPDDRECVERAWRAALDGAPYDIEHRIIVGDTVKWVRERAELEFDEHGGLRGGFGTSEDVTERKQREEELRHALEWLSATQRTAGAGFWDWDMDSDTLTWSEEFYVLFGLPETAAASLDTWRAAIHPDDLEMAEARIDDAIEHRATLDNQYRIVRPDGRVLWISSIGTTTYDQDGRPQRMSGICIDITARRAAETALRESEGKYRGLFEAFHEMIAVYEVIRDEQGRIVDRVLREGNRALVETVGALSIDDLLGRTAGQIFGPEYADGNLPHVRDAMESGAIHVFESHRLAFGEERHFITSVVPLDKDHYLSTGRDITGIKETEEALRDSERRFRELARELEVERAKLAAAIDRVAVGLVFTEGDGTFLSMNAKALELHGFDSAESMFTQFERYAQESELRYPDGSLMPLEDRPMARALRGDYVRDYEARVRARADADEWIGSYSAAPVYGADGALVFIVFSIFDLTERRRLQDALRRELETSSVLLEAASMLAEWTDSLQTLDGVVRLVAAVSGHSRVGLHVWHAEDGELELVAATGDGMPPVGTRTSPEGLSATTRQALLGKRAAITDLDELTPRQRGIGERHRARLSLSVPIVHRDILVGLLAIDEPGERREFGEREIELVRGIAAQTAVAIENAELYYAQRRIATLLQEQFIHPLPHIDGLELAVVSETAHQPELVGGDFHDVFELPHGLVAVLLGDVEGKGVGAAALSETVRSAVRALAIVSPSPRYILNNVNRMLLQQRSTQFVTALLTIVDPAEGLALSASAGHPAGILVRNGTVSSVAMRFGVPLGALPWDHEQTSFRMERGDSLVVYTDGVSEARRNGHIFGEEGVVEAIKAVAYGRPERIAHAVRDAVAGFAGRLQDDMQLVVLRFTGRESQPDARRRPSRLSLVVPDAPWRLIDIRGAVRDFLTAHDVDDGVVDDLIMCVEEACTNALRHSGSTEPTEVRLTIDSSVVDISVRDYGCGFDAAGLDLTHVPDPLALGGRGLYLIRSVVDELELVKSEGTTVHLRKHRDSGTIP